MAQRRPHQVSDGHGWHWLFLAERHLRSPRLEANEIGLVDENLGRFLDQDDAVLRRNRLRDSVQQRRLAGACAPRNEDVVASGNRGTQDVCQGRR
jgi:hypothetical protein